MILSEFVKNWPCEWIQGDFRQEVRSIVQDSRNVEPGDVFVAIQGKNGDGHEHVLEAIERGAKCIFIEKEWKEGAYLKGVHEDKMEGFIGLQESSDEGANLLREVALCRVPNTRKFYAHACAVLHHFPSKEMTVIAVTGTNGKTTTCHFIGQMLTYLGNKTAVIGTNGCTIDGEEWYMPMSSMTTWDPFDIQQALFQCKQQHVTHVVMEASSIGLEQHRLEGCHIDIGVGLAISHDHIEEHGNWENYVRAKQVLIHLANTSIVDFDDDCWFEMAKRRQKNVRFFRSRDVEIMESTWKKMLIRHVDTNETMECPFSGEHVKYNVTAAIAVLKELKFPIKEIQSAVAHTSLPKGRLTICNVAEKTVIIDYAHTPKALEETLKWCASHCEGKLFIVFGCGGNRDRAKRGVMGEIACMYSQFMIVTSDNPRLEDPLEICEDIVRYLPPSDRIRVIIDRSEAIQTAVEMASEGDVILIAGKGHETFQQIGDQLVPHSDLQVVEDLQSSRFLL